MTLQRCKRCALLLAPSIAGLAAHKRLCHPSFRAKAYSYAPMDYFDKKRLVQAAETNLRPYLVG